MGMTLKIPLRARPMETVGRWVGEEVLVCVGREPVHLPEQSLCRVRLEELSSFEEMKAATVWRPSFCVGTPCEDSLESIHRCERIECDGERKATVTAVVGLARCCVDLQCKKSGFQDPLFFRAFNVQNTQAVSLFRRFLDGKATDDSPHTMKK